MESVVSFPIMLCSELLFHVDAASTKLSLYATGTVTICGFWDLIRFLTFRSSFWFSFIFQVVLNISFILFDCGKLFWFFMF